MQQTKGFLAEFVSKYTSLGEIVLVAIFIAFGISLASGAVLMVAGLSPYTSLAIGLAVCLLSACYLFYRALSPRTKTRHYEGFFVYSSKHNTIIPVPRYRFSEGIRRYLSAAFAENKALKILWQKEALRSAPSDIEDTVEPTRSETNPASYGLISEAAEYFVLEEFSTHLTDYFQAEKFRRENLCQFARHDIPSAFLNNRFLELFSKEMRDRPAFVRDTLDTNHEYPPPVVEVVASYKESGELYQRFDLVLPKGSELLKPRAHAFEIKTKKFNIAVSVRFEGMNTVLPHGFEKRYLGVDLYPEGVAYSIDIELKVVFKFGILLLGLGRAYYAWIDSLLDTLDEHISEDKFFEGIGWDTAVTVIECLDATTPQKGRRVTDESEDKS